MGCWHQKPKKEPSTITQKHSVKPNSHKPFSKASLVSEKQHLNQNFQFHDSFYDFPHTWPSPEI